MARRKDIDKVGRIAGKAFDSTFNFGIGLFAVLFYIVDDVNSNPLFQRKIYVQNNSYKKPKRVISKEERKKIMAIKRVKSIYSKCALLSIFIFVVLMILAFCLHELTFYIIFGIYSWLFMCFIIAVFIEHARLDKSINVA